MVVLAAYAWKSNAELIADVAKLYFADDPLVLDPTFGRGKWWTKYRPTRLVAHDKYKLDGVDFRALPEADNTFDVVAYDPPYVSKGGRKTSGIKDFDDRYGLENAPSTPEKLQDYINEGLAECARVSKGLVLVKLKNYISSGKYFNALKKTTDFAEDVCGLTLVDMFIHTGPPGTQPAGRRQVHARNNYSILLVFRK